MSGSAARGRRTRWNCRPSRRWRHAGLCRCRSTCYCGRRRHTKLGSDRRMSGRRSNSCRGSAGRTRRYSARTRGCTRRNNSRRTGLACNTVSRGRCRRTWANSRLRRRRRRNGSSRTCRGLGLSGLRLGFLLSFSSCFGFSKAQEMLPHKFSVIQVKRARVGLLVRDADLRQIINQDFGLDLEFSGQLVDADLIWI